MQAEFAIWERGRKRGSGRGSVLHGSIESLSWGPVPLQIRLGHHKSEMVIRIHQAIERIRTRNRTKPDSGRDSPMDRIPARLR